MKGKKRQHCEFLRAQAKQRFDKVRMSWIEQGRWTLPHRTRVLLSQVEGARNNQHIVDGTHVLAQRSYVAGFMEGNTSSTRPWYRHGTSNPDVNMQPDNHGWLDRFTRRTLQVLNTSNFYHAVGSLYYDYSSFDTATHYIEELKTGLFFHTLMPGTYYVINNGRNEAVVLVREFQLTVKALVETYGVKEKSGKYRWSNFSSGVKKMYEESNYTQMIDVVHLIEENKDFDPGQPIAFLNKQWISYTYELGGSPGYVQGQPLGIGLADPQDEDKYLNISASKRKPFIVARSSDGFEYGEKGPTRDSLGIIKSLNKKAISKDIAMEQMLTPAVQGPARLRKSYLSTAPRSYVPLDAASLNEKGIRPIFEMNPAVATINADVQDLRNQVDKFYYADYLLYLSNNPKTRTAAETNAIVQEQQSIIGPNLQSLNWTYNTPIVEFVADYVLYEDTAFMEEYPMPEGLEGLFLRPEFISVFAQAQRAADLPAIERYIARMMELAPLNPAIWDKVNLDKLADLYEDRLFLPAGLNNAQSKVEAMREQARAQAAQQQMLNETLPAMAGAAKDVGLQIKQ